jgi:hypothetical protein
MKVTREEIIAREESVIILNDELQNLVSRLETYGREDDTYNEMGTLSVNLCLLRATINGMINRAGEWSVTGPLRRK